jgi:NTE family protein
MQVGALQALVERGIYPDLVVGTSAGAINGAGLALDPTPAGLNRLCRTWSGVRPRDLGFGSPIRITLQWLAGRENLGPSRKLYHLICDHLGDLWMHFGALEKVQLRVTAVDLDRGEPHVFGDDPRDSVVDALMASTALHPYLPAWEYLDHRYVDGGVWSNLPLQVALQRGATEIYAIDLTRSRYPETAVRGLVPTLWRMADIGVRAMRDRELEAARMALGDRLHHIELPSQIPALDFGNTSPAQLVEDGHWCTEYYLDMLEKSPRLESQPILGERLQMVCGNGNGHLSDELQW